MRKDELEKWLTVRIARELGLGDDSLDGKAPLLNYLMDGFQSWRVVAELEGLLERSLPASVLYARPNISELADHLITRPVRKRSAERALSLAEV